MSLRYPILLVHGMGFRDDEKVGYWGRIPAMLTEAGCKVFLSGQDANARCPTNGAFLVKRIEEILKECSCDKINVIAHSKGGLDMRYAISTLGLKSVASLTMINTPNLGSKTLDTLLKTPRLIIASGAFFFDLFMRLRGDKHPHSAEVCYSMTTKAAAKFNEQNPDSADVYYQSYACCMKSPFSDMFMLIPALVVWAFEGRNDGLLAPESTVWGDFKGVIESNSRRGISHADQVDARRRPFTTKDGPGIKDILELYKKIIADLQAKGF